MYLNRAHKVLGICTLSTGGTSGTTIDIRLLFAGALQANAHSVIIAHNHPSGNPRPSENDIAITKQIAQAGTIMTISLIDHLIITSEGFVSMKSETFY